MIPLNLKFVKELVVKSPKLLFAFADIHHTANIFDVIFTVFSCVPISTVILLYDLHLIAAPSKVE